MDPVATSEASSLSSPFPIKPQYLSDYLYFLTLEFPLVWETTFKFSSDLNQIDSSVCWGDVGNA